MSKSRLDGATAKVEALREEQFRLPNRLIGARESLDRMLNLDYRYLVAEHRAFQARGEARAKARELAEARAHADALAAERAARVDTEYRRAQVAGWTL